MARTPVKPEFGEVDEVSSDSKSTMASDGESHDIKLPFTRDIDHQSCARICSISLWILLIAFQGILIGWIVLITQFYSEKPSYITVSLNAGIGIVGSIETIFSILITFLALIQLVQKGDYEFVHKCRVMFNVVLGAFMSHLLVFFPLTFLSMGKVPRRLKKDMERELKSFQMKNRYAEHDLSELWERTQEKYSCCGFGDHKAYVELPLSCCPSHFSHCEVENIFKKNCFEMEAVLANYYLTVSSYLLGLAIPFTITFYYAFRYYRPYWTLEPSVTEPLVSLNEIPVKPEPENEESPPGTINIL